MYEDPQGCLKLTALLPQSAVSVYYINTAGILVLLTDDFSLNCQRVVQRPVCLALQGFRMSYICQVHDYCYTNVGHCAIMQYHLCFLHNIWLIKSPSYITFPIIDIEITCIWQGTIQKSKNWYKKQNNPILARKIDSSQTIVLTLFPGDLFYDMPG